jgi:hypothetical protein
MVRSAEIEGHSPLEPFRLTRGTCPKSKLGKQIFNHFSFVARACMVEIEVSSPKSPDRNERWSSTKPTGDGNEFSHLEIPTRPHSRFATVHPKLRGWLINKNGQNWLARMGIRERIHEDQ